MLNYLRGLDLCNRVDVPYKLEDRLKVKYLNDLWRIILYSFNQHALDLPIVVAKLLVFIHERIP